jgi:hypothetical protein
MADHGQRCRGRLREITVPTLLLPPVSVVPYSVDPLTAKLPVGFWPLAPLNETRVVAAPPLAEMLKTVPQLPAPPTPAAP